MQECDRAVYGDTDWTAPELREDWARLDPEQDVWLAMVGGRLAGVMHVYDQLGGRYVADGYVHPELTGRGVGTRLLERAETRAAELAETLPPENSARIESAHLVGAEGAPRLFSCRGYAHVRT